MTSVAIRVDATSQIGTGHFMRCLTLADALRQRGAGIRFVSRGLQDHLRDMLAARDMGFVLLNDAVMAAAPDELAHSNWLGTSQAQDARDTAICLADQKWDWLVVDHYALDARWESALRQQCRKIMVIDDLADRPHDCDLLLDQNLFEDMAHRYDGKVPAHCGRMLGPDYALLQPQYAELHPRVPPREGAVRRVLVFFGGADAENLTGRAIAAFLSLGQEDVALDVVINPASPLAASIRQQVEGHEQITLHEGLPSLAPLMVQADLAVGAGGATSWERCCLGLPALVITLAENQKPIAAELDRQGLIRWLGHKDEVSVATLAQALKDILDSGLLLDWSARCQQWVDGRGTGRVISILMLNAQTPLKARLARVDDEALTLRWANESMARQNDFALDTIDPATHRAWFRKRLRDPERCRLYVVETHDGFPIGEVRFERHDEAWEIDYALDEHALGRELGKPLLQIAMLALRASTNKALLFGSVKDFNAVSRRPFEALGFESGNRGVGLTIAVCSDARSWINASVPELLLGWLADGHSVAWAHAAGDLPGGDLCFYLSYGRIVDAATRARYGNNLVVHASDLPKGKGWSPTSWLILEGADRIPVTLLEAVDAVDAGPIYLQEWFDLDGTELIDDWRGMLAAATVSVARLFVAQYPDVLESAREQSGESTTYPRRRAKDSALDPNRTIAEQFNHLRVVDNEHYAAFFIQKGKEFVLKVTAR